MRKRNLVGIAAHEEIVGVQIALGRPTLHTLHAHPRLLSLVPPWKAFLAQSFNLPPISLALHLVVAAIYNHVSHLV